MFDASIKLIVSRAPAAEGAGAPGLAFAFRRGAIFRKGRILRRHVGNGARNPDGSQLRATLGGEGFGPSFRSLPGLIVALDG